jgi:hypothetical protein
MMRSCVANTCREDPSRPSVTHARATGLRRSAVKCRQAPSTATERAALPLEPFFAAPASGARPPGAVSPRRPPKTKFEGA